MVCGICGRKLKGDESIQRGYGPVCYRKVVPAKPKRKKGLSETHCSIDEIPDYNIPGQMEISDFIDMPTDGGKGI